MAIELKIDTEAMIKRVNGMLDNISHFKRVDIGMEMSDWQVQNMHRHRPFTMRSRAKGMATTKIRPHSLYEMKQSVKAQRRVKRTVMAMQAGKRVRRRSLQTLRYQHYSTRPVLREEMLNTLWERVTRAAEAKIVWKKV